MVNFVKRFLPYLLILWFIVLFSYIHKSISFDRPTSKRPIVTYFEESGADLKYIYCSLLRKAKSSIFLSSFGLTDHDIKKILSEKKASEIEVTIHNSKKEKSLRKKTSGLYHKKILIIDDEEIYIGTANCSRASLAYQGNQIFGFNDKDLIEAVKTNNSYHSKSFSYYLLPKDKTTALNHLLTVIKNASNRLFITMYALSHPDIIKEIIAARDRGVYVTLFLDRGMTKGSCRSKIKILEDAKIPIMVRANSGLHHHKAALVDNTYIVGSVNWSKAGFTRNEETLLIMPHLSKDLMEDITRFMFNTRYYSILI